MGMETKTELKSVTSPQSDTTKKLNQKLRWTNYYFINTVFWYVAGIIDYLNVSAIYVMYATRVLTAFFFSTLIYVLYPLSLVLRICDCLAAWNNYHLELNEKGEKKAHNLVRAIFTSGTVLLTTAAVAATLSLLPFSATVFFGINLVVTMCYNLASGFYAAGKASAAPALPVQQVGNTTTTDTPRPDAPKMRPPRDRKRIFKNRAFAHFAVAATLVMTATTGMLVSLAGVLSAWPLGVMGGLIGAGLCVYALMSEKSAYDKDIAQLKKDIQHPEVYEKETMCHTYDAFSLHNGIVYFDDQVSTGTPTEKARVEVACQDCGSKNIRVLAHFFSLFKDSSKRQDAYHTAEQQQTLTPA